jgi:hypothetical protein
MTTCSKCGHFHASDTPCQPRVSAGGRVGADRRRWLALALLVITLLGGCTPATGVPADSGVIVLVGRYGFISVVHDNIRDVTCWVWSVDRQGGISCLPDRELGGKQ